tara:strand:+ start:2131 stop:3522 length:1392 start_codon:yes stop_codon:yes gene_type:complete
MIEWLKNFFSKTEKPDVGLGSSIYSNWTIQTTGHWMEHFNVESEAQANGSIDLPPSESSSPDQFHAHVKTEFDRFKSTKKNEIDIQINSLGSTLGRLIDNKDTFSQHEEKFTNKIRAVQNDYENRIKTANEDVKASRADLINFKRHNKLTRPAKPMSSQLLFVMILVVILIAETILNGVFLGENLTGSSAAGMTWAFAFSAVNVSIGLILAPLIRNINHIKAGIKLFGYFIGLIWLSLIAVFNFLIGHFRDAITNPAGQGMEDAYLALEAMELNPFSLGEPVSYFLVAIGMMCALVALLDSFFHADTYPGYGKKSLQLEEFDENLLSLKSEANNDQEILYSKFVSEGNKLIKVASAHITNLQQTIGFIDLRIKEEYSDYFENLAGSFEAVIEQYRTSNKEARDTEAPMYFEDKIDFSWRALDDQSQRMKAESEEFINVRARTEELLKSWPDIQANIRNTRKEY